MEHPVIVSAVRTALGGFQGSLSSFRSPELGAFAIKEAVKRAGVKPEEIDEVIMGCVLAAGLGQAPARQALIAAGIPKGVSAITVNKVCSSGLKSVMLADTLIRAGDAQVVVAGGMESMTNAPYLMPQARAGFRMGDGKVVDSMVFDGLWDIYTNQHMGNCAELCADKYKITRAEQDAYAEKSYRKAQSAIAKGNFKDEIFGVAIPQKKGEPVVFDTDEEPAKVKFDKLPTLKPAFKKDGTVTAANASSISDGGAALIVMSADRAKRIGVKPLAKIISHATFSHEPEWFTTAPVGAIRRALDKAGLKVHDIGLFELNEAFSVVPMAAIRDLELDESRVNVNGGAVALGHPIGASGARILVTLVHAMKKRGVKLGLATLCNGGGEATALIVEAL